MDSERLGFLGVGRRQKPEELHPSAQAIVRAIAESQDHVTRMNEAMLSVQNATIAQMMSRWNPERTVQHRIIDNSVQQRARILMPKDTVGGIYCENQSNAANALVYLGENTFDLVSGVGPPPYLHVGPGKWKVYPVNPYSQVGLVTVILDAASTGIVRVICDSQVLSPDQGSV